MALSRLAQYAASFTASVFVASTQDLTTAVDLSSLYNVKAASTGLGDSFANFDGSGRAYPVEWLPKDNFYNYSGIQFALPPFHNPSAYDCIGANSQQVSVPAGYYHSFHSLITSTGNNAQAANLTFNFQDGSSQVAGLTIAPWWSSTPFDGPIHTPYHYANPSLDAPNQSISYNVTSIQYANIPIRNDQKLTSISLPPSSSNARIFAISMRQVPDSAAVQPTLYVENIRSTTKWLDSSLTTTGRVQQFEVTISNLASTTLGPESWLLSPVNVTLSSSSIQTVVPGILKRLRSNDQVVVVVGVVNSGGVTPGTSTSVQAAITDLNGNSIPLLNGDVQWGAIAGIPEWQANDESLATHEAPDWYHDAKFGIFIHYGLYSVPAWAPTGNQYPAWYNWDFHNPLPGAGDSPTRNRHAQVYGTNFTYDDFLANWTAIGWDADVWTDLFADSGAKYFVFVTKHHDGILLWDGNSTDRTSVKLGPKRNFLQELMDSAKSRHPEIHRGLYFSLPEWFSPAYQPHGKPSFPGGSALNAFTGECCDPYTGYTPVSDFLHEVQKPQMEDLFYDYDAEMLWCDIGFDSVFPEIGAGWYNYAAGQGRQVVMNNRCGANQSDFVTPEYATFNSPPTQKWEATHGMDPYAFAFNSDTPIDKYENATGVIHELVDIVSKGGNLLLGVGPKEDGSIIPAMHDPLIEVGQWLKFGGESIYGTRPWWTQNEEITSDVDTRFTTTTEAFYIIARIRPTGGLKVNAPVPVVSSDKITLLGGDGQALNWTMNSGTLTINVDDKQLDQVNLPAWAFKVTY